MLLELLKMSKINKYFSCKIFLLYQTHLELFTPYITNNYLNPFFLIICIHSLSCKPYFLLKVDLYN